MPNAAQRNYGPHWDYLKAKGWAIKPSPVPVGTACADGPNKTIWMKPAAFHRPSTRVLRYVVPHEIWHGIDYEVRRWENEAIQQALGVDYKSAREVVADGAVLHLAPSRLMRAWVRASVNWHGRVGYRYRYAHLTAPETLAHIKTLTDAVDWSPRA